LFLDVNPLASLKRFSIEVVVRPATDGADEQRFLHFEEATAENRALLELRLRDHRWALDTYLRSGQNNLTLLDRRVTHAAGQWHVIALTYDGRTMISYVDGVRELSGDTSFAPLGEGRASIGVRQNRVSWFKGQIHSIRITPEVLAPAQMLAVPKAAGIVR
jgi:hypothetical protein